MFSQHSLSVGFNKNQKLNNEEPTETAKTTEAAKTTSEITRIRQELLLPVASLDRGMTAPKEEKQFDARDRHKKVNVIQKGLEFRKDHLTMMREAAQSMERYGVAIQP